MEKIDFNDTKTLRHWEERIARFEGIEAITKGYWVKWGDERSRFFSVERYGNEDAAFEAAGSCAVKNGVDVIPHVYSYPSYSTSLPDLFRVLRKIERAWSLSFSIGHEGYYLRFIGAEWQTASTSETEEQAIFQAICQYLRRYHPTVGEEQEEIERGTQ